jgi:hypothetical protein
MSTCPEAQSASPNGTPLWNGLHREISDGEPRIGFKIYFSATGRRAAYSSMERMAKSFTFRCRRASMMACAR